MAMTPYLLFLNPDTLLFSSSLSKPLAYMEDNVNQKVGVCGIQLLDEQGLVARSCARFPTWRTFMFQSVGLNKLSWFRQFSMSMVDWDHKSTQTVDQVIGAFFLVRKSLFKALRGFDQRFFVYFEELDFSRRLHSLGYSTVYLADTQAFHAGGGTSKNVKAARLFYLLRSRLLYGFKHFSPPAAWAVLIFTIAFEPFTRVIFSIISGQGQSVIHTLKGYRMLIRDLPTIIRVAIA
jgi:Predicted glycosyltransferases